MDSPYLLESLARALDVVDRLQLAGAESTSLLDLARQTSINKTTVLRILRTLEHRGWVVQPAPGRYRSAIRLSDNRTRRIGYSSRDNRLPFPRAVTASITRSAAAHGAEILSFDNRSSRTQTIRNAERMIREKADIAIVFQVESDTGPELSSLFNESGTPLISIDMTIAGATYFGADNYSAGITAGRAMAKALAESGHGRIEEIILVGNMRFGSLPAARLSGFMNSFETHYPRFSTIQITTLDSRGSFETGLRLLRARMRSTRRRRGIVVCVSDPAAMGAVQAIEEAGRAKDWLVWSFGGGLDIRLELRRPNSPLLGAVGFGPEEYGTQLWNLIAQLLEKKPAPPALFAKMKILTRANINTLYPHDHETPR